MDLVSVSTFLAWQGLYPKALEWGIHKESFAKLSFILDIQLNWEPTSFSLKDGLAIQQPSQPPPALFLIVCSVLPGHIFVNGIPHIYCRLFVRRPPSVAVFCGVPHLLQIFVWCPPSVAVFLCGVPYLLHYCHTQTQFSYQSSLSVIPSKTCFCYWSKKLNVSL